MDIHEHRETGMKNQRATRERETRELAQKMQPKPPPPQKKREENPVSKLFSGPKRSKTKQNAHPFPSISLVACQKKKSPQQIK